MSWTTRIGTVLALDGAGNAVLAAQCRNQHSNAAQVQPEASAHQPYLMQHPKRCCYEISAPADGSTINFDSSFYSETVQANRQTPHSCHCCTLAWEQLHGQQSSWCLKLETKTTPTNPCNPQYCRRRTLAREELRGQVGNLRQDISNSSAVLDKAAKKNATELSKKFYAKVLLSASQYSVKWSPSVFQLAPVMQHV